MSSITTVGKSRSSYSCIQKGIEYSYGRIWSLVTSLPSLALRTASKVIFGTNDAPSQSKQIQPAPLPRVYSDPSKLLNPVQPNASPAFASMREWELNFGLLYSAYQRTDNEETKTIIRFLMTNYLQKAGYLNQNSRIVLSDPNMSRYQNMLQLGQMTNGGMYHRSASELRQMDLLNLESKIGSPAEVSEDLIPIDTIEIEWLFKLGFVTTPDLSKPEEIVDILVKQFEAHIAQFPGTNMELPILIDITEQIGPSLITDGDAGKIKLYEEKKQTAKEQIVKIFKQAAEKIQAKYPDPVDIQS